MKQRSAMKKWFDSGSPWVWLNAGAVSISLVMVVGLIGLIAVRGLSHFWPADIVELSYAEPEQEKVILVGERVDHETVPAARLALSGVHLPDGQLTANRTLLKIGNRDFFGLDFKWINDPWIEDTRKPEGLMSIERREWGNFYGYLVNVKQQGNIVAEGDNAWDEFQARLDRSNSLFNKIKSIEKSDIGKINHALEDLRIEKRRLELDGVAKGTAPYVEIEEEQKQLDGRYEKLRVELNELYSELNRDQITVRISDGREADIPLAKIVQAYKPNTP